ncbi:MAG: tripartite tricarboxylate transporter permease [Thermosphaera sp.]
MDFVANPLDVVAWSLAGATLGLAFSWIPGLHVFNLLLLITLIAPQTVISNPSLSPYFALGAVVAFSFMSSISATYLSVADDSMVLMLFPSQRYLLMGHGHKAVLLYLLGALGGSLFLVFFGLTFAPIVLPVIYNLFSPFYTWILVAVVVFLFMSEWPKEGDRGESGLKRLVSAWTQIGGGILVFLSSGILGLYANYSGLIPIEKAFARLTPLFIGFFGMSSVIRNILSHRIIPQQDTRDVAELSPKGVVNGIGSGVLGGGIAAFFPVITGGMGALIGGHMASSKGDDTFMVSQGAARVMYYSGALLLLFTPTSRITRGAVAWLVGSIYTPKTWIEYYYALFTVLLIAGVSFIVTLYMSKIVAKLVRVIDYRYISLTVAILLISITFIVAGPTGLLFLAISTGIGFAAIVFNTRLSYCLGALILPTLLSMTGTVDLVLPFLGLGQG